MKHLQILYFAVAALLLTGCLFDSGEEWRDGEYSVLWIDTSDNLTLNHDVSPGGSVGRVDRTVIAVGSNKYYVVAKQHPDGDVSTTNYFIIDRAKDHQYADQEEFVIGPFTKFQYEKEKIQLDLPEFTHEFL